MDTPSSSESSDSERVPLEPNVRTRVRNVTGPPDADLYRELITSHLPAVRRVAIDHPLPGLGLIAIDRDDGSLATSHWTPAFVARPTAFVVGRHSESAVALLDDEGVSLRHLLIIVHPLGEATPRLRVMDLRTPTGFYDAERHCSQALDADGPTCLQVGRFILFLFPTMGATAALSHEPTPGRRLLGPGRATTLGPSAGPVLGLLDVACDGSSQTVYVTPETAGRGILLGRYERCDVDAVTVLNNEHISRVHAAVLELGGRLYAFDTASTHGLRLPDQGAVRVIDLRTDPGVELGEGVARFTWHPTTVEA